MSRKKGSGVAGGGLHRICSGLVLYAATGGAFSPGDVLLHADTIDQPQHDDALVFWNCAVPISW
jgi:hypothetical protein